MAEDRAKSPYPAFATFDNFISDLAQKPAMVPPRIDNSVMKGMSGGTQSQLKLALRFFGLVEGEDDAVADPLRDLVRLDSDGRKARYAEMVVGNWPEAMDLASKSGTAGQLSELFTDLYGHMGSTKDKAIRFFLQMAEMAGVELSPNFAVPRAGPAVTRKRRKKIEPEDLSAPAAPQAPPAVGNAARMKTLVLGSGGTVTLSYDVDLFDLSDADQAFVLDLIKKMKDYEAIRSLPADTPAPVAETSIEGAVAG